MKMTDFFFLGNDNDDKKRKGEVSHSPPTTMKREREKQNGEHWNSHGTTRHATTANKSVDLTARVAPGTTTLSSSYSQCFFSLVI